MAPLTPGHFLIGRALQAYPEALLTENTSLYKRWNLCQAILQHFWQRWSSEYLQQLQTSNKWHKTRPNLQVGDIVLMTDGNVFHTQWTMAKVTALYKGKDGLVRAVDVQTETVIPHQATTNKDLLASKISAGLQSTGDLSASWPC